MINIALFGNPNVGKTTVFNLLTGSNQYVGNWPGVTIEKKEGYLNEDIKIVDLPGIYAMDTFSNEEKVSKSFLENEDVDVILNIVDASNLSRNLYLTTQLMKYNKPIILLLNMLDLAESKGIQIDYDKLANELGIQIVPIIAKKKSGTENLEEIIRNSVNLKPNYIEDFGTESETYEKIDSILADCTIDDSKNKKSITDKIDNFVLNPILAYPIFIGILFLLFRFTFDWVGGPLQDLSTTLIENYNLKYNKSISGIDKTKEDLANLYEFLIENANETRKLVKSSDGVMKANTDYKGIINRAYLGYENILDLLPNLSGNYSNAKYVMSSKLMCYTGITGIYFPFTGEANVNVAIPDIYIPSTTLHEMAHQRGYASEDEANFIAYLASINHPDIDFKYSGYILALNHTANALYSTDYNAYVALSKNISEDVLFDLRNNKEFWKRYEGKIDDISNEINNTYLKANGVSEGVKSYGKMVDLLLVYYSLYPYK